MVKLLPLVERAIGVHSKEELLKLREGKVAIVGMGCDGCEAAEHLVRTGIGSITICDKDVVEESNLLRQRLYSYSDIGIPKVYASQRRLQEISPHTPINVIDEFLSYSNGENILKGHDIIMQGLDSICARIMLHEIAQELGVPIITMSGQPPLRSVVSTVMPHGPSYQELFNIPLEKPLRQIPEEKRRQLDYFLNIERAKHAVEQGADKIWYERLSEGKAGWSITLGRAPVTGTLQVNEAIRLLTGKKPISIAPKIIVYDGNGLEEFGFPNDLVKILEPKDERSWDYRMF